MRQTRDAFSSIDQTNASDKELVASYQRDMEKLSVRIVELENLLLQKTDRKTDLELMKFQDARNSGMLNGHIITEDDWLQLRNNVETIYPNFYDVMNGRQKLSEKEYKVCLLVKAHFTNSDIEILMDQKSSYASNTKKRLCKKVYGYDGTAAHFEQRLHFT